MGNLLKYNPDSYNFLAFAAQLPRGSFMGLFANTGGQSMEKEIIVYQTIHAMIVNYNESGNYAS